MKKETIMTAAAGTLLCCAGTWAQPSHAGDLDRVVLAADNAAMEAVCDWRGAEWIGDGKPLPEKDEEFYRDDPAPQFRKTFSLDGSVRSARLHIAGLGLYEAQLNGKPLSDNALAPLWTPYRERVLYDTFDVTEHLLAGTNVLAVTLGNGWYNPLPLRMWGRINPREFLFVGRPCLRARLDVALEDGRALSIPTDTSWKVADSGPLLRNSLYLGEVYDARREIVGWDRPGFDDSEWKQAEVANGPPGKLEPRGAAPPIGIRDAWPAVRVTELQPGIHVIDLGRNFSGYVRCKLGTGESGDRVTFRYGELLNRDGTVNTMTGVAGQIKKPGRGGPGAPDVAEQKDVYIRRGSENEAYAPRFTWHAFRYVQIKGLDRAPGTNDVEAVALASRLADAGTFECSDPQINRLFQVCRNTFLSNVIGVQSDCPARERFGYGADIAVTTEALIYNFDMHGFYAKTLQDFADEAAGDGWFTETAPYVGIQDRGFGGRSGPIGWTVAVPILMRDLYRYYGDRDALARHYDACVRYLELVRAKCPNLIVPTCIGDHEALDKAARNLTATAHFFQWAKLVAGFASILGKDQDAAKYQDLADEIRTVFQKRFVVGGKVGQGKQGEQVFGLYHKLVPESDREEALAILKQNITERDVALSTGIYGTQYLLEVLSNEGDADLAGRLVARKTFPGWLHMLNNDATTLWENWRGSDNIYSQNHPMFGSVSAWMMKYVLGIAPAQDAVGFDRITIRPHAVAGLTWARGTYVSARGPVSVDWRIEDGRMNLEIEIPSGIQAWVWMGDEEQWLEAEPGSHRWEIM